MNGNIISPRCADNTSGLHRHSGVSDTNRCANCANCERIDMHNGKVGARCSVIGRVTDTIKQRYEHLLGSVLPVWCKNFEEARHVP